jgi:hypothetical protein
MYSVVAVDVLEAKEMLCQLWSSNLPVRGRVDEKLRWFYCDGPHGPGRALLLTTSESTVGCAGVGVRRFLHHGYPLHVGLFADLAVDPHHRSALPAVTLLRSVHALVERNYDLGYGFPNDRALAVYRRAGYRELGQMHRYVRVLRIERALRPALGRWLVRPVAALADGLLAAFANAQALSARGGELAWLGDFDARFDRLWDAARETYPLACERTSEFLRWRFAHESHSIVARLAHGSGELRAYAVLRPGEHAGIDILDLFACDERELGALLAQLVVELGELGYASIAIRFLGNPRIAQLLGAHGFVRRTDTRTVMVAESRRAGSMRLRELDDWYLTDLDEDT